MKDIQDLQDFQAGKITIPEINKEISVDPLMRLPVTPERIKAAGLEDFFDGIDGLFDTEISQEKLDKIGKRLDELTARHRLPDERRGITHKFSVGGHEGYITVGLYDHGAPGEVFITMSKEGSTMSGFADCFATMVSISLQYGIPLKILCRKFISVRFDPQGWTPNPDIPEAHSLVDYIFRWLAYKYVPESEWPEIGLSKPGAQQD